MENRGIESQRLGRRDVVTGSFAALHIFSEKVEGHNLSDGSDAGGGLWVWSSLSLVDTPLTPSFV